MGKGRPDRGSWCREVAAQAVGTGHVWKALCSLPTYGSTIGGTDRLNARRWGKAGQGSSLGAVAVCWVGEHVAGAGLEGSVQKSASERCHWFRSGPQ